MKTDFQNGERLFAEDLNTNFAETDNRLTATETVANAAIAKPSAPSDNQALVYDSGTSSWVAGQAGKVLQVVNVYDATERSTGSDSLVDASLSLSITPVSGSSYLHFAYNSYAYGIANTAAKPGVECAITDSSNNVLEGAQAIVGQNITTAAGGGNENHVYSPMSLASYIAASDTSARTYKVRFRRPFGQGTAYVLRQRLVIMEIAG